MEFSLDSLDLGQEVSDFFETPERQSSPSNELQKEGDNGESKDLKSYKYEGSSSSRDGSSSKLQEVDAQRQSGSSSSVQDSHSIAKNRESETEAFLINIRDEDHSKFRTNMSNTKPTPTRHVKFSPQSVNNSKLPSGSEDMAGSAHNVTPNQKESQSHQTCLKRAVASGVCDNSLRESSSSVTVLRQPPPLSPWERWVVQKANLERERRERRRVSKVS